MSSKKVAIVAGGSGAIGQEICRNLAEAGYDVALTFRANAAAARAVEERVQSLGRLSFSKSVALEESDDVKQFVDEAAERFGQLNSVVYAAGPHLEFAFISAIKPSDWKRVFDSDVNGCFNLLSAALPHLRKCGNGAVVAVTTSATEKVPVQDILSAAPKVAIEMLIKGIAKEEGRYGVRANCVGPGFLTSGIGGEILQADAIVTENIRRQIPLKRFGNATEIASAVTFLLSENASYISGQSLAVDGGLQL